MFVLLAGLTTACKHLCSTHATRNHLMHERVVANLVQLVTTPWPILPASTFCFFFFPRMPTASHTKGTSNRAMVWPLSHGLGSGSLGKSAARAGKSDIAPSSRCCQQGPPLTCLTTILQWVYASGGLFTTLSWQTSASHVPHDLHHFSAGGALGSTTWYRRILRPEPRSGLAAGARSTAPTARARPFPWESPLAVLAIRWRWPHRC